jgi:hypothetical protein
MPIIRAGIQKDGQAFFGDASWRAAYLRKQAILGAQAAKNPPFNQQQKPVIGDHHLANGRTNGVEEVYKLKNPGAFI